VVVAGADAVAVDATCCRVMHLDPLRVGYLRLSASPKQLGEAMIPQLGENIVSVAKRFALLPELESLRLPDRAS
jgi:hypothetical protein